MKCHVVLLALGLTLTAWAGIGVELIPGPNAVLNGTPEDIAKSIADEYGLTFEEAEGLYGCDYKKDIQVIVTPHPDLEGQSIVIGAYTGQ